MKVMVVGGTREGRALARRLDSEGLDVTISTATEYGVELSSSDLDTRYGALGRSGWRRLIDDEEIGAIVDATHPFAQKITRTLESAVKASGIAYFRFRRPPAEFDESAVIGAANIEAAAELAAQRGKRIFLATGVKSICRFVRDRESGVNGASREYFARVLPVDESINEAVRWLPRANLITGLGPFDVETNCLSWQKLRIDTVVTKNSGAGAGVEAKVEAAVTLGINIIMIERPIEPGGFSEPDRFIDQVIAYARRGVAESEAQKIGNI